MTDDTQVIETRIPLGGTLPFNLKNGDILRVEGKEVVISRKKKLDPIKKDYTREELIELCEAAIVPMSGWLDRDSYGAQKQVGECWALLKAGVPFRIDADTDRRFIHVTHYDIEGFNYHEYGNNTGSHPSGYGEGNNKDEEGSYLPTRARLDETAAKGWKDWYG